VKWGTRKITAKKQKISLRNAKNKLMNKLRNIKSRR